MSSVLVKGMKMPDSCYHCKIAESCGHYIYNYTNRRYPDCPLIALPDHHGRLVDADALQTEYKATHGGKRLLLIDVAPTIEPERTEYIADTKALSSNRDCVDLSERVTATFYDDEHEEWSKKTVTIRDVLDSVCDDYTVIEPECKKGRWIDHVEDGYVECPFCHSATNCEDNISDLHFCFSCGAMMKENEE